MNEEQPKKCPFLKIGVVPASGIAGSRENILVVGNCMKEQCELWVKARYLKEKYGCGLLTIPQRLEG